MLAKELMAVIHSRNPGQAIGIFLDEEEGFGVALWLNAMANHSVTLIGATASKCEIIRDRENLKPASGFGKEAIRWRVFVPEPSFNAEIIAETYAPAIENARLVPKDENDDIGWEGTVWDFWERASIDERIEITKAAHLSPEEQRAVVTVSNLGQLIETGKLKGLISIAKSYPWMFC